jgi:L-ascorbate metabolism protein UlaG (beta-lactamase superfamily)
MQPTGTDFQENTKITFVGHATTLTEMSGVRILTDPIFRDKFRLLTRRDSACVSCVELETIDAVALSHMHFDHMDYPSLRMIPRNVPVIAPEGAARYLRKKIPHDIAEMRVGDSIWIGDVEVKATPSLHHSGLYWPFWYPKSVLSYMFNGSQTVFFIGDTALFEDLRDLGRDFDIDVALLPVWGCGPYLRGDHMTPAQAAEALGMLAPRTAIPIHWGTIHPIGSMWKTMAFLDEPPHTFAREAARTAPMTEVRVLTPGESTLVLGKTGDESYLENLTLEPLTTAPTLA